MCTIHGFIAIQSERFQVPPGGGDDPSIPTIHVKEKGVGDDWIRGATWATKESHRIQAMQYLAMDIACPSCLIIISLKKTK